MSDPAIFFEADAYLLDGPRLMGRQSAGNGFLRAAVAAHTGRPIHVLANDRSKAAAFQALAIATDPDAQIVWIPSSRLERLRDRGVLYRPDGNIGLHARERLRVGAASYSVTGVTHTLSSHGPADLLADMAISPLMPWDALICTSTAARTFVEGVVEANDAYLAWRFGQRLTPPRPQLPIIPLGVHPADFEFGEAERAAARSTLGIEADETVALFVGRLTFNAKAHPYQMLTGMEAAARASGRKLVLIQAGRFPSEAIGEAFRSAAQSFAPSVRAIFVDGGDNRRFAQTWRAADLFVSLSDNYQETFGITPLEAMASGLPVLVSDWDGYKDTVRDGVEGFRVPTWAPQGGLPLGAAHAADFETGATSYDFFLSRTSTTVSVDVEALNARLFELVTRPDLRHRMGEAGRARVREVFDWAVVYRQYEALWGELDQIRARLADDPALRLAQAPSAAPSRPDPFAAFSHYPSRWIGPTTTVTRREGATAERYQALVAHAVFMPWAIPAQGVAAILQALGEETLTVAELAARVGQPASALVEPVARLAKMELLRLTPP